VLLSAYHPSSAFNSEVFPVFLENLCNPPSKVCYLTTLSTAKIT
jgi:hypothetical protein